MGSRPTFLNDPCHSAGRWAGEEEWVWELVNGDPHPQWNPAPLHARQALCSRVVVKGVEGKGDL